jgi:hypothetical protein
MPRQRHRTIIVDPFASSQSATTEPWSAMCNAQQQQDNHPSTTEKPPLWMAQRTLVHSATEDHCRQQTKKQTQTNTNKHKQTQKSIDSPTTFQELNL